MQNKKKAVQSTCLIAESLNQRKVLTICQSWTVIYELRTANCKLWSVNCELWSVPTAAPCGKSEMQRTMHAMSKLIFNFDFNFQFSISIFNFDFHFNFHFDSDACRSLFDVLFDFRLIELCRALSISSMHFDNTVNLSKLCVHSVPRTQPT